MLQCVAVCLGVLFQGVEVDGLPLYGVSGNPLIQCGAACCCASVMQCVAACYSVLQCVAVCCSELQNFAVYLNMLQQFRTYVIKKRADF